MHSEVASEWQSFYSGGNALVSESRAVIDTCKSAAAPEKQTEFSTPEIKSGCAKLMAIATQLGLRAEEVRQLFAKTESVWNEEERKQREIVRASDYVVPIADITS